MRIHPHPAESCARALLSACGLPDSDLEPAHFEHFLGCGEERDPKGIVGLELLGDAALLRSLAVDASVRGRGCGTRLVREAERLAAAHGVTALYLLTETADGFFESLGYARVDRGSVPDRVRATREFASLCPASARVMCKRLGEARPG